MQFAVEAMRPDGTTLTDLLEAGDRSSAVESLRSQGLMVLRVEPRLEAAARPGGSGTWPWQNTRFSTRDLILLTRQLKMLLEAGAPLVGALEAAQQQTTKPLVRELLTRIRERVEEGDSLSDAIAPEERYFDSVFRSMISAGEATGALPEVFSRLSELAQRQQQARKLILGALLYPIVLCGLLTVVLTVMLFFVVPRFKMLFSNLRAPLPFTTQALLTLSESLQRGWPYVLGLLVAATVTVVLVVRSPGARARLDNQVLRLPVVGRLMARLIFARVVRIWAAMLRCHVPLLETIRQSREAVSNNVFLRLVLEIEETVAGGGRVGQALARAKIADPVIVSAICTGEDNGRLAEATDFVSSWMDDDNATAVQHVTRLAEPLLLAIMGVVVGVVAMSLFIPLFDLAANAA